MPITYAAFFEGLGTGFALIIAIGAQNAFILKQGLLRNHVFTIALICTVIDASLIAAGVQGLGIVFQSNALFLMAAKWGGAAFLVYYGLRSFLNIFTTQTLHMDQARHKPDLRTTIVTLLALSLLNPHVYLDTVVLVGSIGAQFPAAERTSFMIGAMVASTLWFFSLSYGAKLLTPLFKNPLSWKILDGLIGLIMWGIAFSLLMTG